MKWLTKFYLLLFITLFSGSSQLYAYMNHDSISHSSTKTSESSEHILFDTVLNSPDFIKADLSAKEKENDKIDPKDNEDEEDELIELISFKKYLEINNYFSTVFYTQSPGYFHNCIKESLPACTHIFSSYSRWYIIFRVIRI